MMSATLTTTNGRPQRKQLSDQLDRLDSILDALAEALPEAVADACREGARQAVKVAVAEILASPELRSLITGLAAARVAPPPAPAEPDAAKPGVWSRLKSRLVAARTAVTRKCRTAGTTIATMTRTVAVMMPLRKILAVGTGVGVVVGVASYACPHTVSAVIGGIGAACTAVAAQVGRWFRRSNSVLGFGGTD
jgi:hypothetical protein